MDKNKLILENINLATNLANRYQRKYNSSYDLMGYANLGLVKAANNYKENNNCTFKSYAYRVITNNIIEGINKEMMTLGNPHTYRNYSKANGDIENYKTNTLSDIAANTIPYQDNIEEIIDTRLLCKRIRQYVNRLQQSEREAIKYFFGIEYKKRTLTKLERDKKNRALKRLKSWIINGGDIRCT